MNLIDKILEASNIIAKRSRSNNANYMVVGAEVNELIEDLLYDKKKREDRDKKLKDLLDE